VVTHSFAEGVGVRNGGVLSSEGAASERRTFYNKLRRYALNPLPLQKFGTGVKVFQVEISFDEGNGCRKLKACPPL